MYDELAVVLRAAREMLAIDQAEVAVGLGVGQQTVSAWERGRSRPRRAMLPAVAGLLRTDESVLLRAGGYLASTADFPDVQRARTLPLGSLTPDRFEDLTAEIVQLRHPESHVTRFGGQGEKQFGIDVLAAASNGHNEATAQCKRYAQFGAASVAAAVRDVTIAADKHYLFLSRTTASPGARKEMGNHAQWQLWDGEDISRYIRKLPLDRAVRLVDTYFPGHREAFLGVRHPVAWLLPEDYFLSGRGQIFSHDWTLAGRAGEVAELSNCLYESTGKLGVVVGRGGIGKTRLLRALAESCPDPDSRVFILPSGVTVEAASYEQLPDDQPLVLLIDDAHERKDLAQVIAGVWRQNPNANVLVATRPYRWDSLRSELARTALLPDSTVTVELDDLALPEAENLAREALGNQANESLVHRLARLTRDCPLVTVVGGSLIRRGQLDPGELSHDDHEVRDAIMRGFRNALVADPMVVDPETRNSVLDIIAAVQPFRTDDDSFRIALSDLVGKPYDVLNKHLRILEEAGILRRRGAALRIVPDLLGDVVLAQACFDEHSQSSTGFMDRVRTSTHGDVLQHLFVNASRVDWQIRQKHAASASLVESLWEPLEAEVRRAGIETRQELLRLIARVAYFQPRRVVTLARWLIDNPTDQLDDELVSKWAYLRKPTHGDVLSEIPAVLKAAAYHFDTLPEALNLLWVLAQLDTRPTNQYPDHPRRVLRDLAEYEIGKPTEYNNAVLDIASTWFTDGQRVSPFEVLEPLLATEGTRQTYHAYTLTFQPFALNVDVVEPIRERLIALAIEEMQCSDVQRAVAAVDFLGSALRYPGGMFGRTVTSEERARWTNGFVHTIQRLGEVASHPELDPVVLVAVRKALNWHATYSKTATNAIAASVVEGLRDGLRDRVALIIHDGRGHLVYDRERDYATAQEKIKKRLDDAVAGLCSLGESTLITLLTDRLAKERYAFGPTAGSPGHLVGELVKARPPLAAVFIDLIISRDAPAVEPLLPVVLATGAEADPDGAVMRAGELLALNDPAFTQAVSQSLGWNRGRRPLATGERELLLSFATHPDPSMRHAPAFVAQRLAEDDPGAACELIASIDFSDSPQLADEVFTCFAKPYGLAWDALSNNQIAAIRSRLVAVPEVDQHWITSFLAERSAIDPDWVISLLQDRVMHAEGLNDLDGYRPMPFSWGERLRVRDHQDFIVWLRRLHAWIAERSDSWIRREMGAEVFEEVARPFDQSVLAVLGEALASSNPSDLSAVAAILRKAHRTLIWDAPEFLRTALHAAARVSDECRSELASALWGATISGTRMGSPGKPFKEDVEQRERSRELAARMPHGSLEQKFYLDIAASAEGSIARAAEDDRPGDGREW